jgi:polyhydroxybutyrate depolymerase
MSYTAQQNGLSATQVRGTSGCGSAVTAGTTTQTLSVNGVQRTYLKVVPPSINPNTPVPVILGLHGGNDTAENANAYMGLTSNDAVLYVYPQAEPFADAWAGWDVDPAGADFPFIDALLADLKAKHCVAEGRTFAAGKSNGAFFVNSLLCNRPASFTAAASVAGGGPPNNCSQPRKFMGIHGTADTAVPISTGRESRDYWLAANGWNGAAPLAATPAPCVSYKDTLNPVIWCQHSGAHIWPSWAGAAIRSFFLGVGGNNNGVSLDAVRPPPPTVSPAAASFTSSPNSRRVSKTGRFTYTFRATPGRSGTAKLTSTRSVKVGAKRRKIKLPPASFTSPANGTVKLKLKLSRKNLKALKAHTSLPFKVSVTIGSNTVAAKVKLKPPKNR